MRSWVFTSLRGPGARRFRLPQVPEPLGELRAGPGGSGFLTVPSGTSSASAHLRSSRAPAGRGGRSPRGARPRSSERAMNLAPRGRLDLLGGRGPARRRSSRLVEAGRSAGRACGQIVASVDGDPVEPRRELCVPAERLRAAQAVTKRPGSRRARPRRRRTSGSRPRIPAARTGRRSCRTRPVTGYGAATRGSRSSGLCHREVRHRLDRRRHHHPPGRDPRDGPGSYVGEVLTSTLIACIATRPTTGAVPSLRTAPSAVARAQLAGDAPAARFAASTKDRARGRLDDEPVRVPDRDRRDARRPFARHSEPYPTVVPGGHVAHLDDARVPCERLGVRGRGARAPAGPARTSSVPTRTMSNRAAGSARCRESSAASTTARGAALADRAAHGGGSARAAAAPARPRRRRSASRRLDRGVSLDARRRSRSSLGRIPRRPMPVSIFRCTRTGFRRRAPDLVGWSRR